MIHDHDRVGFIGASDTRYVMMKWTNKTFTEWWNTKIGLSENLVDNIYTRAGNAYEGKVLDYLELPDRDGQTIIGRLRVNFDAMTDKAVVEVKTYQYLKGWKPYKYYYQQCQVEMYAAGKERCLLYHYGLLPSEYEEYTDLDPNRLGVEVIEYDEDFINEYIPRFNVLAKCIESGETPNESDIEKL